MRKLDNWLTAIGAGGIVTILTVLSGFKLDFLEIWKGMGKMNGQHWFLIFFSVAFIVGIAMKISEQRVTPRNVQRKIESWLKRFRFGVKPIQWDKWHFGLQIIERGIRMYIARPKEREQYISLIAPITPLTPDLKKTYDSLGDERQASLGPSRNAERRSSKNGLQMQFH
jgi:hypothetical protein